MGARLSIARHDGILSFQSDLNVAGMLLCVLRANGGAIRTAHEKSSADSRATFINTAVHVGTIQRDAPPILTVRHHTEPLRKATDQVIRNVVLGFQNNNQTTAYCRTGGTTYRSFCSAIGRGHVCLASEVE